MSLHVIANLIIQDDEARALATVGPLLLLLLLLREKERMNLTPEGRRELRKGSR